MRELAQGMSFEALERLRELMHGRGVVAVRAAEAILDRAWGRPTQPVAAEVDLTGHGALAARAAVVIQAAIRARIAEGPASEPNSPGPESEGAAARD